MYLICEYSYIGHGITLINVNTSIKVRVQGSGSDLLTYSSVKIISVITTSYNPCIEC
jgi:hypothetical protein